MKWNGVRSDHGAGNSLNLDNIPMNATDPSKTTIEVSAENINKIKQELQADELSGAFRSVIPADQQNSTMQSIFGYDQPIQNQANEGFYLDSINNIPMKVEPQPHVEMTTASSMNLNFYMEKNKKTGRPKS